MTIDGIELEASLILHFMIIVCGLVYPILNHIKRIRHTPADKKARFNWNQFSNTAILGAALATIVWGTIRFGFMPAPILETPHELGMWIMAAIGTITMVERWTPGHFTDEEDISWKKLAIGGMLGGSVAVVSTMAVGLGIFPMPRLDTPFDVGFLYAAALGMVSVTDKCLLGRPADSKGGSAGSANPPNAGGNKGRQTPRLYPFWFAKMAIQRTVAEVVRFALTNFYEAREAILTGLHSIINLALAGFISVSLGAGRVVQDQTQHPHLTGTTSVGDAISMSEYTPGEQLEIWLAMSAAEKEAARVSEPCRAKPHTGGCVPCP